MFFCCVLGTFLGHLLTAFVIVSFLSVIHMFTAASISFLCVYKNIYCRHVIIIGVDCSAVIMHFMIRQQNMWQYV